jgi:2-amino-4-hydroxy-6-hydroxymethyldihydropteridine diphosphokinase
VLLPSPLNSTPDARVYLGLGSNLGDPSVQLQNGLESIRQKIPHGDFAISKFVQTPPLAGMDQPDYVNCVCSFSTALPPLELLTQLRHIEDAHGRTREIHWGARTLDIDILLYGQVTSSDAQLTLPHPGIEQREFVLVPLLELNPELCNLNGQSYSDILKNYYSQNPSQLKKIP